jgi:hypothetical protein
LLTAIRASNVNVVVALRDEMRTQRYQLPVQVPTKSPVLYMIAGASLLIAIFVIGIYFWQLIPAQAAAPTATIPAPTLRIKGGSVVHTGSVTPAPVAPAPATTQVVAVTDTVNSTSTAVVIVKLVQVTAVLTATPLPSFPCQDGQIKANAKTMIYHLPTGAFYAMTRNSAVICFDTPAAAEQAGYRASKR